MKEARVQVKSWFVWRREPKQPKIATLKEDFGVSDLDRKTTPRKI